MSVCPTAGNSLGQFSNCNCRNQLVRAWASGSKWVNNATNCPGMAWHALVWPELPLPCSRCCGGNFLHILATTFSASFEFLASTKGKSSDDDYDDDEDFACVCVGQSQGGIFSLLPVELDNFWMRFNCAKKLSYIIELLTLSEKMFLASDLYKTHILTLCSALDCRCNNYNLN